MISDEQANQIKKQIISQIEKSFPEDKKEFAIKQVQDMNNEQLETFLKQNNLKVQQGQVQAPQEQKCIFCSIASGEIESFKIDENKTAIAVLEINPISKGHTLIIPKQHVTSEKDISKTTISLANKIKKKLKSKLKPEKIEIKNSNIMNHEIINIIPIYKETDLDAERKPANKKELAELQKNIKPKPKPVKKQPQTQKLKPKENLNVPKRIP